MNEDGKEPDEYMYPRVQFVEYSPTGEILMIGMMALGFVKDLEKEGRLIIRTDVVPPPNSVVDLKTKQFVPQPPKPIPTRVKEPEDYARARANAYPPLREFAEALTEKEMGNDAKWTQYMQQVQLVRETIPKTKSSSTTDTTE